jgi:hypothetical protein
LQVASGRMSRADFADWLRTAIVKKWQDRTVSSRVALFLSYKHPLS